MDKSAIQSSAPKAQSLQYGPTSVLGAAAYNVHYTPPAALKGAISTEQGRGLRKLIDGYSQYGLSHSGIAPPPKALRRSGLRGKNRAPDKPTTDLLTYFGAVISAAVEKIVHDLLLAQEKPAGVEQLVERTPVRRLDVVQERLQLRMVMAVLNGTAWLSSTEVDSLGPDRGVRSNPHARANRLLSDGKVFAIERAGRKEYPRYAFDALGNPYPAIREVLQVFGNTPALRVASWFESTSAALDGRRPREVLDSDPAAVVRAAREHIEGPMHG